MADQSNGAGGTPVLGGPPHANNPENEQAMFKYLLEPDDSYTAEGSYWADLPISKRVSFIMSSQAAETSKELGTIASMLKADPLSPFAWYFRNAVLPGAGIGLEGYDLQQRSVTFTDMPKVMSSSQLVTLPPSSTPSGLAVGQSMRPARRTGSLLSHIWKSLASS
jgi:hypothetical protein